MKSLRSLTFGDGDVASREEAHAGFFRLRGMDFLAVLAGGDLRVGLMDEAVGTPVFFSGGMNLPREDLARSGAAISMG